MNPYLLEKYEKCSFKFSYSTKRDIIVCPHRYDLLVNQKIPQSFDMRRLLLPDVLDLAMTDWVELKFPVGLEDILVSRYRAFVKEQGWYIRWKSGTDMQESETEGRRLANVLEQTMRQAELCRPDAVAQYWVGVGLPLSDGRKVKLTGKLDLLYTDTLEIYDLKTTKDRKWLDEKQLVYYDFAVSLQQNRKVKRCGFLVPLMDPPVQLIGEVGREQWDELLEEINYGIGTVASGEFPDLGVESEDCFMCFAKRYCKRYNKPLVHISPNRVRL